MASWSGMFLFWLIYRRPKIFLSRKKETEPDNIPLNGHCHWLRTAGQGEDYLPSQQDTSSQLPNSTLNISNLWSGVSGISTFMCSISLEQLMTPLSGVLNGPHNRGSLLFDNSKGPWWHSIDWSLGMARVMACRLNFMRFSLHNNIPSSTPCCSLVVNMCWQFLLLVGHFATDFENNFNKSEGNL